MGRTSRVAALMIAVLAPAVSASATDRMEARAVAVPAGNPVVAAEVVDVVIMAGKDQLWSGSLRVGGQYGSASFSQSISEFAEPCPGEPRPGGYESSNRQLNFNISRRDWQQEPDRFYVNVTWSEPLPSCEGEGGTTFGFNRVVTLPRDRAVTVSATGAGGLAVRLTRRS